MAISIIKPFLNIAVLKIGALCLQRTYNFINTEAVVQRCSLKKVFLENWQNSKVNTCATVSFLIKLQTWACKFVIKETLAQVTLALLLLILNFLYVPSISLTFSKKSFQNFQNITNFSEKGTEYT